VTVQVVLAGNPEPLIVMELPTGPLVGLKDVIDIVHAPAVTKKSNEPDTVEPLSPAAASLLTVMGPVAAPPGTGTTTEVFVTFVGVAVMPLNFTNPLSKSTPIRFVPVIVTLVLTGPHTGLKLEIVGAGKAVTVKASGVASAPALSVTTTLPVVAAGGTTATTDVVVGVPTTVATWPLNVTLLTGKVNVPEIVTWVPAGPVFGFNDVASAADACGASVRSKSPATDTTPSRRRVTLHLKEAMALPRFLRIPPHQADRDRLAPLPHPCGSTRSAAT
jgi:hypothetical protein